MARRRSSRLVRATREVRVRDVSSIALRHFAFPHFVLGPYGRIGAIGHVADRALVRVGVVVEVRPPGVGAHVKEE